eukprot:61633-Prorocentrum_minimum.AAC.1
MFSPRGTHPRTRARREYSRSGNTTNRGRGERIYPQRAPIAGGEREYTRSGNQSQKGREYTRSGNQSQKGRENIPAAGTNHRRGERIYPRLPVSRARRGYATSEKNRRENRTMTNILSPLA